MDDMQTWPGVSSQIKTVAITNNRVPCYWVWQTAVCRGLLNRGGVANNWAVVGFVGFMVTVGQFHFLTDLKWSLLAHNDNTGSRLTPIQFLTQFPYEHVITNMFQYSSVSYEINRTYVAVRHACSRKLFLLIIATCILYTPTLKHLLETVLKRDSDVEGKLSS